MGATYVAVTVRNLGRPERAWEGEFLVDTRFHHSLVPRKRLEAIGIEPEDTRLYELADGTSTTFDVGAARLDFMDEHTPASVIFGADDAEPVLGRIALTSAALRFDPVNQRFERIRRFLYSRRPVAPHGREAG